MLNRIAIAALLSGMIAQMAKVLLDLVRTRKLHPIRVLDTGGMPSSHTALVTTLTIGIGMDSGVDSSLFSVTLIFSLYFIFEATGLRQEVGKQARILNEIVDDLLLSHHFNVSRLKELVGHTWGEVFIGLVLGFVVAVLAFS